MISDYDLKQEGRRSLMVKEAGLWSKDCRLNFGQGS